MLEGSAIMVEHYMQVLCIPHDGHKIEVDHKTEHGHWNTLQANGDRSD